MKDSIESALKAEKKFTMTKNELRLIDRLKMQKSIHLAINAQVR